MFFRREKLHIPTFNERIENVKKLGIAAQPEGSGRVRLSRDGIGAMVSDIPNDRPHVDRAGLTIGSEIGASTQPVLDHKRLPETF